MNIILLLFGVFVTALVINLVITYRKSWITYDNSENTNDY